MAAMVDTEIESTIVMLMLLTDLALDSIMVVV